MQQHVEALSKILGTGSTCALASLTQEAKAPATWTLTKVRDMLCSAVLKTPHAKISEKCLLGLLDLAKSLAQGPVFSSFKDTIATLVGAVGCLEASRALCPVPSMAAADSVEHDTNLELTRELMRKLLAVEELTKQVVDSSVGPKAQDACGHMLSYCKKVLHSVTSQRAGTSKSKLDTHRL